MIDIHCHLLPGIDDGPPGLEAALALAAALVEDGVETVVCTPHVFPGRYDNVRNNIAEVFGRFCEELALARIPLKLCFAGEVRLTPEVLLLLAQGKVPFLGRSAGMSNLLLEMPDGQIPLGTDRFVAKLMSMGIRPVIAHPERNRAVMDKPQRLAPLVEQGCLVQLTAASVTGHFGERAQEAAATFLDQGWVQAVASDAHNLSGRRPRMTEARAWLAQRYGEAQAQRWMVDGPAELCGENLPTS